MSKSIKVTVKNYPATFDFPACLPLPPFEYGCKVRTRLVQEAMRIQRIESRNHLYTDYLVEQIETLPDGSEVWHLGS